MCPYLNDDYRVAYSEEEDDLDQFEEEQEDDEEISARLLKDFGSTMNTNAHDEIENFTE